MHRCTLVHRRMHTRMHTRTHVYAGAHTHTHAHTSKYRLTFSFVKSCHTKGTIFIAGTDPSSPDCLSAPTEGELLPSLLASVCLLYYFLSARHDWLRMSQCGVLSECSIGLCSCSICMQASFAFFVKTSWLLGSVSPCHAGCILHANHHLPPLTSLQACASVVVHKVALCAMTSH